MEKYYEIKVKVLDREMLYKLFESPLYFIYDEGDSSYSISFYGDNNVFQDVKDILENWLETEIVEINYMDEEDGDFEEEFEDYDLLDFGG